MSQIIKRVSILVFFEILVLSAFGFYVKADSIPNYFKVFPKDRVNRIDIKIDAKTWQKMLLGIETHFGKFGKGMMMPPRHFRKDSLAAGDSAFMPPPMFNDSAGMPNGFPGPGMPPNLFGDTLHKMKKMPGPGFMPPPMSHYDPDYVQCTLQFEGQQWTGIGIRFKGNSSLMSSWARGIMKFPFRLEFGKFNSSRKSEKKFYGFREISFSSNNDDQSLLREKLAADLFRAAGVKSAHTAFYRVFIDYGEGPQYFGLYTAVEVVDDTVLKDQFGDGSGNCYKPEGPSASFSGTFNSNSFEKKTNKKSSGWQDVQKLFNVINAGNRKTNPDQWKKDLETIFDVPAFLNWLAVNTVIQNWDTYGQMAHNYYLYNNPVTHKFVWIPWDNNEALMQGKGRPASLSHNEVSEQWPLIRYLLDQPSYMALYKASLASFLNGAFSQSQLNATIDYYHHLITPYAVGTDGEKEKFTFLISPNNFEGSVSELEKHIEKRIQITKIFLEK
jgi:hypothetical protein